MDKVVLNLLAELLFMRITLDVQMGFQKTESPSTSICIWTGF